MVGEPGGTPCRSAAHSATAGDRSHDRRELDPRQLPQAGQMLPGDLPGPIRAAFTRSVPADDLSPKKPSRVSAAARQE